MGVLLVWDGVKWLSYGSLGTLLVGLWKLDLAD